MGLWLSCSTCNPRAYKVNALFNIYPQCIPQSLPPGDTTIWIVARKNRDFKLVPGKVDTKKSHVIFKYLFLKMMGLTNKYWSLVFSNREHIGTETAFSTFIISLTISHVYVYRSFLLLSHLTISYILSTVFNPSSSLSVPLSDSLD